MARPLRALVVEDCDDDALLVAAALGRGGYDLTYSRIQTAAEMRGALESGAWDIVLCDHNLPQFDAPSALRLLRSMDADLPFIIISGTIGEDVAVEALKQGADDYLLKQNLKRLIPAVERSLEDAGNRRRRRAAEKANALIMAHSAEVICTVGSDFRLLEVSAAARTVWGYEPEELKGAQLLNLVHPDDFERTREAARQTLAGKPVREFENRNICKDGSVVYMTWSTYWSAAEALGFCIGRDVTERQRAAEALQASEGRLRSYIENAPMAIAILDAEGRYVSANRSALDLVGWDSGMLAARSFRDLFSEEDLPAAVRDFQTLLVQGHMDGEYRLARQDGGVVWVLLRAVKAGDGRYMAFCTDVTGRKETERLLLEREAHYRGVIETSADGFWVVDPNGRLLEVNDAYVRRSGYSREELLGMSISDLEASEAPEETRVHLKKIAREGSDLFQTLHRTRDGTIWQAEISANCWPGAGPLMFVFIRDVNRRKRSEALRRAQLAMSELALHGTPEDLLRSAVDAAELLTESRSGFFYCYCAGADARSGSSQVWSSRTLPGRDGGQPWAPALSSGVPVMRDEADGGGGEPARELAVPVLRGDRVVGVIGAGAKSGAYTADDVEILRELASVAIDLVERKWAEAALRESQERLSLALNATGMGVWEWDLSNDAVYWSQECHRLLGVSTFGSTFEAFAHFVHPEDLPRVVEESRRAVETKTAFASEFRVRRADGEERWLANLGQVRYDVQGRPERMIGTVLDITERRRAEAALRASEERFRSLVETTFEWIWEVNAEGRYTYASPRVHDLLGYEPEEVLGLRPVDLMPAEEAARMQPIIDGIFASRQPFAALERTNRHKGGTLVVLETTGVPVFGAQGELLGYRGLGRDITERKRAQQEAQRFVSLSPVVIYALTVRPDGLDLAWASDNIFQLTGFRPEETLTREWFLECIHPEDLERVLAAQPSPYEVDHQILEFRIRRKDGVQRWVRDEKRLLRDGQGKPVEVIGSWSDVTERVQLEEQLRHAQKMESIGRLAGGVAHDFNNLLTVINGYTDLLLARSNPRDPYRPSLEEIRRAGQRAAELTGQLLAFSRKQVLKPRPLNLDQVIGELQSMLQRLLGEDIELKAKLNGGAGIVSADPSQLEQVIMNLVVNARDAMPEGGRLTIATRYGEWAPDQAPGGCCGGYVELAVSDTGTGMDAETLSRIFEPFFTTKESGKGTGLGLSVVHGIVEQSGGRIEVESRPGEGATFRVYLPRTNAPVPALEPKVMPDSGGSETILVVEDQPQVLEFTAQALAACGYNVIRSETAGDALVIFEAERKRIDLVLTDVVMPHMSGWELSGRLRAIEPDVKVLYMSGYADSDEVHNRIRDAGAKLIQKPFTPKELATGVREALGGARSCGRILVVDDEGSVRLFLRLVLERAGYRVAEAADGRQAMNEARRRKVDLLLTDIVMPEQEGFETIGNFRREMPEVKIIAMSGRFDSNYLRLAEMLGAHAVISKPIDVELLLVRITEVLALAK